jgi:hypothetical protein
VSKLERIGRYRVERRLGSGAFALVWLGHDEVLDAPVAIKVLAENWAHQLDLRARFVEEARVLRRADSDRVVRVFDIGDLPDGRPYFVMSYADRGTLEERLEDDARLPVAEALRLAELVARGVAVVHGLGVIHRDLKPSNVLFQSTAAGRERLLIADLGLSKALAHASGFTVAAGSPGYMAPEQQIIGGGIDVRVDVYGIGAIAYRMLTGSVPQAGTGGLKAPSALRDGLPAGTDSVLARALEIDRERRWPSARALADALAELASRIPVEAADEGTDDEPTVVNASAVESEPEPEAPPVDHTLAIPRAAVLASLAAHAPAEGAAPPPPVQAGWTSAPTPAVHPSGDIPRLPVPVQPVRSRRRWPWLVALLAVLGAGAGGAAVVLTRQPPTTTTVRDNTGQLAVTVPVDWGRQLQNAGWSPKDAGLGTETNAAGLAVATDLAAWRDPARNAPGVFVGVSRDTGLVAKVGRIAHAGCTQSSAVREAGGLSGTVYRYTSCPGGVTFAEVALRRADGVGVYVQVKQPADQDHTEQVLASLQIG